MSTVKTLNLFSSTFRTNFKEEITKVRDFQDDINWNHLTQFYDAIYPYAVPIVNPLCPMFVSHLCNIKQLNEREVTLSLDGLAGLLPFFLNNDRPMDFKGRLIVRKDLEFLVPHAWQKCISSYEIRVKNYSDARREEKIKACKSVYLYIQTSGAETNIEAFREKVRWVKEIIPDTQKIKLLIQIRSNPYETPKKEKRHEVFDICKVLYKEFGFDINFITIDELYKQKDLGQSVFMHLNQEFLGFSYNYIENYFLQQGSFPLSSSYAKQAERESVYFPLGPFHGFNVFDSKIEESNIWNDIHEFDGMVDLTTDFFGSDFFEFSKDLYQKYVAPGL